MSPSEPFDMDLADNRHLPYPSFTWHDIEKVLIRCFDEAVQIRKEHGMKNDLAFHNKIQDLVKNAAGELHMEGKKEFGVKKLSIDKNGKSRGGGIDVIYRYKEQKIAVIEIDSSYRKRSVNKLKKSGVDLKFWLYYGSKYQIESNPDLAGIHVIVKTESYIKKIDVLPRDLPL